jgi:DNA polymerase III epsilon subunit-like protein
MHEPGVFERHWAIHGTPEQSRRLAQKRLVPATQKKADHRLAIALDCEMGTAYNCESELIRLSVLDYFTGEVLINSLVFPDVQMLHYNTRYSGVTRKAMNDARRKSLCLKGRAAARAKLWQFVGPETIVIMHGGHNDMKALRWTHPRIIDTFVVEGERESPLKGRSLKNLTQELLGRTIQKGKGHCSLEDAMACRDLVKWYVDHLDVGES